MALGIEAGGFVHTGDGEIQDLGLLLVLKAELGTAFGAKKAARLGRGNKTCRLLMRVGHMFGFKRGPTDEGSARRLAAEPAMTVDHVKGRAARAIAYRAAEATALVYFLAHTPTFPRPPRVEETTIQDVTRTEQKRNRAGASLWGKSGLSERSGGTGKRLSEARGPGALYPIFAPFPVAERPDHLAWQKIEMLN